MVCQGHLHFHVSGYPVLPPSLPLGENGGMPEKVSETQRHPLKGKGIENMLEDADKGGGEDSRSLLLRDSG